MSTFIELQVLRWQVVVVVVVGVAVNGEGKLQHLLYLDFFAYKTYGLIICKLYKIYKLIIRKLYKIYRLIFRKFYITYELPISK